MLYKKESPGFTGWVPFCYVDIFYLYDMMDKNVDYGVRMKEKFKKIYQFLLNPKLLLCLLIGWMITNGWSYIVFGFGVYFNIPWMISVGGAYLAFLWLPISPEKLVTVAIAVALLRFLFPDDQKTLAVLKSMYANIKTKVSQKKRNKDSE